MAQQGCEIHPTPQLSSCFFFPKTLMPVIITAEAQAMDQEQWVKQQAPSQRKALSNASPPPPPPPPFSPPPPQKTWFLSPPPPFFPAQRFLECFQRVILFLLLPHLSLAANTQLLGYLSRAPIKGCQSGSQCPSANHIRAPAHALPPHAAPHPAILITFKYFFHRWPISCLWEETERGEGLLKEMTVTDEWSNLISPLFLVWLYFAVELIISFCWLITQIKMCIGGVF